MRKVITLTIIALLIAGCVSQPEVPRRIGVPSEEPQQSLTPTETPGVEEPGMVLEVVYGFAPYTAIPVYITGSVGGYPFEPESLDNISLTEAQIDVLKTNGFVVIPASYDQFYSVYQGCKDRNTPIFVTTDSMLHTYHILYDYTLRVLETQHFSRDLLMLTENMSDASLSYYRETKDTVALKNVAYFCVAGKLLSSDFEVPLEVQDLVQSELDLINAHEGFAPSPIFGYMEDYSQYVPRGHYTRSDELGKYFKAMMWYGRIMFRLKSEEETLQALYIVKAIRDTRTQDLWSALYDPTVFFVGKSDDLNIYEYDAIATSVYGDTLSLDDFQKLQEFMRTARKYRDPRINSGWVWANQNLEEETKGFRFMGQRFIPDSYMFQQLVYDKVGTEADPRLFPKGLDVMAVLGSERALYHLEPEKKYYNYEQQREKLIREFSGLDQSVWTQNLYWTWLYCLMPLLQQKGGEYPPFMQSEAWADKDLNTALGSWTELRHDTILYAKQSYTLLTAIPSQPQLTRGYVEPDPYVYARLASLARMMREGLEQRDLLLPEYAEKLETLEDLLVQMKTISEKELSGKPLTEEEYTTIWSIGDTLEALVTFQTAVESEADKSVAVVADVHTDANTMRVLEEGVGDVFSIFVIVKVEGRIIVAEGGVFSYYEFLQPMSQRLTDEEWQTMEKPALPEWTRSFVVQ